MTLEGPVTVTELVGALLQVANPNDKIRLRCVTDVRTLETETVIVWQQSDGVATGYVDFVNIREIKSLTGEVTVTNLIMSLLQVEPSHYLSITMKDNLELSCGEIAGSMIIRRATTVWKM